MASNLIAMASNLLAMASNLLAMAFNLIAMASNLLAMASDLLAIASNLLAVLAMALGRSSHPDSGAATRDTCAGASQGVVWSCLDWESCAGPVLSEEGIACRLEPIAIAHSKSAMCFFLRPGYFLGGLEWASQLSYVLVWGTSRVSFAATQAVGRIY